MRDLFQVVFELKKKEMDEAKQLMNKENRVRDKKIIIWKSSQLKSRYLVTCLTKSNRLNIQ